MSFFLGVLVGAAAVYLYLEWAAVKAAIKKIF